MLAESERHHLATGRKREHVLYIGIYSIRSYTQEGWLNVIKKYECTMYRYSAKILKKKKMKVCP